VTALALRTGRALGALGVEASDGARRALLRQICRVRPLRRVFVDGARRLLAMQALALVAAFTLALRWPLISLWIGAALFGVPHVLGGVRAVAVKRRVSVVTVIVSLLAAGVGVGQLAGAGDAALRLFVILFAVAVGAELAGARRGLPATASALAALTALVAAALASPRLALLALIHLHGLGSLAFFAMEARRRRLPHRLFVGAAVAVMVAGVAGALDGALASTLLAPRGAAGSIVREAVGVAGQNASWAVFHRGLFLYAFGQSLHFAVWLRLMPEVDRRARVPKPLGSTLADFRTDFGRWAVPLLLLAGVSVVLLFAGGGPAREAYFALTYFHVGLEAAALARRVAGEPRRRSALQATGRRPGSGERTRVDARVVLGADVRA